VKSFCRRGLAALLPFFLLTLAACQRPEETPQPADLLPKERMASLLADLQQLEAQVENSHLAPDSARALYLAEQKNLFWKTKVTDSTLQRSYRYYAAHGKDLPELYQAVVDTLKGRQQKLEPLPVGPLPTPHH
jgi:hypothetical protein